MVEAGLSRGDDVTVLNRGLGGPPPTEAQHLRADRSDSDQMARALGTREWDVVVDTWAGAPDVVSVSCELLRDRVQHCVYVSSRSVYLWPIPVGADESAPVVSGDPLSADEGSYPTAKRGSELAVLAAFADRALLARAGLILGPYENVGRLPWWLDRVRAGGLVAAPGPADRPIQYIDARDLAVWLLAAGGRRVSGAFNTVSVSGHATMGQLLKACVAVVKARTRLVWLPPEVVEDAGVKGWTDLPIWVPPTGELAGLHDGDVSAAYAEGLRCRPIIDTVRDTWEWWRSSERAPSSSDHAPSGPGPKVEAALDAAVAKAVGRRLP